MSEDFPQSHPEELPTEQQHVEATNAEHTQGQQGPIESQVPTPYDLDSRTEIHVNDGSLEAPEELIKRESGEGVLDNSTSDLLTANDSGEALFSKDNLRQTAQEYIERNANSPLYDLAANYSNINAHKEILGLAANDIDKLLTISGSFMDSLYSDEGSVYQALDAVNALYNTYAYDLDNDHDGMADGYYSNYLSLDNILAQSGTSFKSFMTEAGEDAESLVNGAVDALNRSKEALVQSLYEATVGDKDNQNRHVSYGLKSDLRTFVNSAFRGHMDARDGEVRSYKINQLKPYPEGDISIRNLRDRYHAEDSDLTGSFTSTVIGLAQSDIEKFVIGQIRGSMDVDYDSGEVKFHQSNFHFGRGLVGRGK